MIVPWKKIATAPKGTVIVVPRPGDERDEFGTDIWRDGCWWRSRPAFPPKHWCTVSEMKATISGSAHQKHVHEVTTEALAANVRLAAALKHERGNVDRLLGLIDEMLNALPPDQPPQRAYYNEVTAIVSNDRLKTQAH